MSDEVVVNSVKKKRASLPKMSLKKWLVLLIVISSVATAFYYWQDAKDARSATPEAVAARNAEETNRVLSKLEQILVPVSDDEPTVARIEDASILQEANADFYKDAKAGDYLVLYPQRAVIFREDSNKVINFAPIINTGLPTDTAETVETEEQ